MKITREMVMISIHAPARGATLRYGRSFLTVVISIHAPARGATVTNISTFSFQLYFNPRSREGSDAEVKRLGYKAFNFNPRSREGSDCTMIFDLNIQHHFNPRSREGSDRTS